MKVYRTNVDKENPGITVLIIKKTPSEAEHNSLIKLRKTSDLMFIFPKEETEKIDPDKFSNLYGAVYYSIIEGRGEVKGIWGALNYLEDIDTRYTSLSALTSMGLLRDFSNLYRLQISQIETSVFKTRDLTREEMSRIYTITPRIINLLFGYRLKIPRKKNNLGTYTRKTSDDQVFFLRPWTIRHIREKISPEVIQSFEGAGIGVFLSSMIDKENHLNLSVNEANV